MRYSDRSQFARFGALLCLGASPLFGSFTNVTNSVGIDYLHAVESEVPLNSDLGLDRETCTVVSNHAGAAAIDVDGDGWTDFLGARYNERPVLYMNRGNGTFVEEGGSRGLGAAIDAASFGGGDFDNDGDVDLFMAPHRGDRFYLFINDGAGHFSEEAIARGAAIPVSVEPHEGYSIGLVDYDLDGYLDVYVSEWGPGEAEEARLHSVLLRNAGEANPGRFSNVTEEAGLLQPRGTGDRQRGFSTAWADFDGDGFPDLALLADFGSSLFYWNNGNGTFTEGTDSAEVGLDEFGMGVAVADYDNDGDLDYYATSIFNQQLLDIQGTNTGNKLYRNIGNRRFEEVSDFANVARAGWSWGAAFFEFDNDGDADLIVTNGMDTFGCDSILYEDAVDDRTMLYQNNGAGKFIDIGQLAGIADTDLGKAVVVFDYDNDGDEDLVITNTFGKPIVYRSNASENGRNWIRFQLRGQVSNRDGYGALVQVTAGGKTQVSYYNPTNAYIGQREAYVHFGLGNAVDSVDEVYVRWPSGLTQTIENLDTDSVHLIEEPDLELVAPLITLQPKGGAYAVGDPVVLSVEALSDTPLSYVWEHDGEPIPGATKDAFEIERMQPFDAGAYQVTVINAAGATLSQEVNLSATIDVAAHPVARLWNEFLLDAIRKDFPAPTIHGRNLYHTSAAMWDAFWAFEEGAWSRVLPAFHKAVLPEAALEVGRLEEQRKAISYAAYRILRKRYENSVNKERIRYNIDWLMYQLGYDPNYVVTEGSDGAAVGNRIGYAVLADNLDDGSNEANGYADASGYVEANEPLVFTLAGAEMNDPNRWQPLAFDFRVSQNGIPLQEKVQRFVGVNWREVETFAIEKDSGITIAWDPGPPPLFGTDTHDDYVDAAVEVIRYSSKLDPNHGEMIDISPGGRLNNPLGTNDGVGRSVNPVTGEPYIPNEVRLADYGRILAEFWADGPASETPPGHWNTLLNEVSDHPDFEWRYMGVGEPMPQLEWYVQSYLALNGAMHDAAVAAWTLKRQYDYARPISMIRYLAGLGQSSDPDAPNYHPQGLPLIPGLIETIASRTVEAGERHEHLAAHVGKIAIRAWAGEPSDADTQVGGVDWILGVDWMPYQRSTFVTPAFAGYVSGHSTFSRAAAEVVSLITGSPYFPGGLGEFHFERNESLEFELGPSEDVTLQWATYFDAADQAGISRLYGGIHVRADDFIGRTLGARVGVEAFLKAHRMRSGALDPYGLKDVRLSFTKPIQDDACLLRLQFEGKNPVPVWSIESTKPIPEQEGAYFVIDRGNEQSGIGLFVRSQRLKDVKLVSDGPQGAQIAFTVENGPQLISARTREGSLFAESAQGSGTEIRLFAMSGNQKTLLSSSVGRETGDTDSIVEVLALRDGIEESDTDTIDVAIVTSLETGDYLLEVVGEGVITVELQEER